MSHVRATALQLSLDLQLRTLQLSRYARSKRILTGRVSWRLMPRRFRGASRRQEVAVAAAAVAGSLYYCWCASGSGDSGSGASALSPRTPPTWPGRGVPAVPSPEAELTGGGIFESLDDDMVLLVVQRMYRLDDDSTREVSSSNGQADVAAAALICVGGINRQWRRLSGLRCFWQPLCRHHFKIGMDPIDCPRWSDRSPSRDHTPAEQRGRSNESYYAALGLSEGATAEEIAAAYTAVVNAAQGRSEATMQHAKGDELPAPAEWRQCWLSWHGVAASQIGHAHKPLQRCEPPAPPGGAASAPAAGNQPIDGQLWCRVIRCWRQMHDFCEAEHPAIIDSLLPPADTADWIRFLQDLNLEDYAERLEPLRLLYCVRDMLSALYTHAGD